jgi:hypothetical protein
MEGTISVGSSPQIIRATHFIWDFPFEHLPMTGMGFF